MSSSDSTPALRQRRQALVRQLERLEPFILRGSLIERFKRCGKPGCKCARGPGHGPKYYLSISQPGARPEMDYVPVEYSQQVSEYLHNFQQVRQLLEQICNLNRELLRRRVKF
ncbi:MAG: DUF6788 family protein [Terrimicrobiaceae bacterium]